MCVFCKIISGEYSCYKLYENDRVIAFLDISQSTIGHSLVVPKKHFANIYDIDQTNLLEVFKVVQKLSQKISKKLNTENVNIINNNGSIAGQTVDHFHVHVIPRYSSDGLIIDYPQQKLSSEEFLKLQEKILGN